jgi:PIN domain nuclease of toxin-antitoxin system
MKLILDTHAFLWRATASPRLSRTADDAISLATNEVFVSAASAWEISTKHRIGKLPAGEAILARLSETIRELRLTELPISIAHGRLAGSFEMEHRDPFDRMLAAQAAIEGAALVTLDAAFAGFPVSTLW